MALEACASEAQAIDMSSFCTQMPAAGAFGGELSYKKQNKGKWECQVPVYVILEVMGKPIFRISATFMPRIAIFMALVAAGTIRL